MQKLENGKQGINMGTLENEYIETCEIRRLKTTELQMRKNETWKTGKLKS